MIRKYTFILVLLSVITVACTQQQAVGNDKDEHGCIGSAGYTWCEVKQKCLREWEEPCDSKLTLKEAIEIANGSECTAEGKLTDDVLYNENTGTWWIDLDLKREGCAPACVIREDTKSAEINWRCTGLIAH